MCNIKCEKCQTVMQLQAESLTQAFWVCPNRACNQWVRLSTVIDESKKAAAAKQAFFDAGAAVLSVFSKHVFK